MVYILSSIRLQPLSSPHPSLTFYNLSLGRFPVLGRQPWFVHYLKREFSRIFLFCPVYQKCWKNLSIINWLAFLMSIVFSLVCNLVSGYGWDTATLLKVLNDVAIALDSKQCYAAIFIDLAKAFDTLNHSILVGRLRSIGVYEGSLACFAKYLSQRVQCIKSKSVVSATTCHRVPLVVMCCCLAMLLS